MAEVGSPSNTNEFIEQQLDERIEKLGCEFGGQALSLTGPIFSRVDDLIRDVVEKIASNGDCRSKLLVLLTTQGGYIETVERIVQTLRRHYEIVEFIIPDCAYSAGTVLALSGDAIHMDYYSRLGPIDPQIESRKEGRMLPALGILERYNDLIERSKDTANPISMAEIQLLLSFDQAELYNIKEARELSITLLEQWLVKYKFKNWTVTETRKIHVTEEMKSTRARDIATQLSKPDRWHSHGRGISKDQFIRDLNLKITDFGDSERKKTLIHEYHRLLVDYMGRMGSWGVIHVRGSYRVFGPGGF